MAIKKTLRDVHRRLKKIDRKKKRRKTKFEGSAPYETLEPRKLLNATPVAQSDRLYYTDTDTTLTVFASEGLLANDFDLEQNQIDVDGGLPIGTKARNYTPTLQGGSLVAFETGQFTYFPPAGFTGIDSFQYQAIDELDASSFVASVNIAVGTPLSSQLNAVDYQAGGLLHNGAATTTQPLGGGLELNYRSDSIPTPIIAVETRLNSGTAVPDSISVTTSIGGVVGEVTDYNTDALDPNEPLRFVQRVLAPDLPTGVHDWTMTVTLHYAGGTDLVQEFTGSQAIVNRGESEFGAGWWLSSYDRLHVGGDGALLVNSDGDTLQFTLGSNGQYDLASGDTSYSTLVDTGNGFTLTDKWGDSRRFDASGRLIAVKRLNNTVDEFNYAYDQATDRLLAITDQFGRTYSFSYDAAGRLMGVNDFAG